MSTTTCHHNAPGSAIAASKPSAPMRLACRARRWSRPTQRLCHRAERLRHLFRLRVRQVWEERQRDRPRRDVLADRELALPVAERLAVVAHEVDRGQVGLALHAALAQGDDRLVAVDAVRQLDDVDEPPALVTALVRAGT